MITKNEQVGFVAIELASTISAIPNALLLLAILINFRTLCRKATFIPELPIVALGSVVTVFCTLWMIIGQFQDDCTHIYNVILQFEFYGMTRTLILCVTWTLFGLKIRWPERYSKLMPKESARLRSFIIFFAIPIVGLLLMMQHLMGPWFGFNSCAYVMQYYDSFDEISDIVVSSLEPVGDCMAIVFLSILIKSMRAHTGEKKEKTKLRLAYMALAMSVLHELLLICELTLRYGDYIYNGLFDLTNRAPFVETISSLIRCSFWFLWPFLGIFLICPEMKEMLLEWITRCSTSWLPALKKMIHEITVKEPEANEDKKDEMVQSPVVDNGTHFLTV